MYAKNQIFQTRKSIISIVLLLGVLLSSIGAGNLPVAQAQKDSATLPEKPLASIEHVQNESIGGVPENTPQYLLYIINETIYAQEINSEIVINLGSDFDSIQNIASSPYDIYDIKESPINTFPSNNYGFYHGIWSLDKSKFVHIELQEGSPFYRIQLFENGQGVLLLEDKINPSRGYLDPLGWTNDGRILFTERHFLDSQSFLKVWQYLPESRQFSLLFSSEIPFLQGKNIVSIEGTLGFLGIDELNSLGYFFDFESRKISTFKVTIPENRTFSEDGHVYTMAIGIITGSQVNELIDHQLSGQNVSTASNRPAPFLYWPLADSYRNILQYPYAPWALNNGKPAYSGHQGTDVSVSIGTTVYASASGTIVNLFDGCPEHTQNYSNFSQVPANCPRPPSDYPFNQNGKGYHNAGNAIYMSHTVTVNGNNQTWYTFYGHLKQHSGYLTQNNGSGIGYPGVWVARGTSIAQSGHSGVSTLPHLHFEIRNANSYTGWDDPWGSVDAPYGASLWVGGNNRPVAANSSNGSACPGPSLSSPGDGYVSSSQTITFSWSGLSGCTFNGYTFRINDSSNLDDSPIVDTGVGGTSRTEPIGTEWNNRDLWWGVKAANAPNGSSWSESRKFRIQPSNSLPSDYGFCSEEGQTCAFSGIAQIYYGANNQFIGPVTKTDGVGCNNDVFGDPIPGTHKQCFIKGGRPQGSTFCANENGTCSFGSTNVATVYYGANGRYNNQTGVVSAIACNNSTFGDPFSGIGKSCYYTITGSNISTPSNPSPADNTTFSRTNNTVLSWNTNGTSCIIDIWGGSIDISPGNNCASLTLGNQRGGAYNWQVTASNGSGSATGPIWHFNIKPYGPTNLAIGSSSATQVTLNWALSSDEPEDIDGYEIYQDGQYVDYVTAGISSYVVDGLVCNSSYSFYVKSTRQGVLSDASNTVNRGQVGCIPAMPDNFIISGATSSSLTLSWQDNSNNESGFKIYRWDYDGADWNFIYLDAVGAGVTTYTQANLDCESDFNYYEVSAYNGNGESEHTSWIQGTTSTCPTPDLTVSNISIEPASPFTNDDVLIYMDISNLSNNAAADFWIDFYIDDTPTGCSDWANYYGRSNGLAANTTENWYFRIPANTLGPGTHQFRAYVDSGCEVTESNEGNNISSATNFTLTVPAFAPPSHDDFNTARLVSPIPYNNTVNVSGATTASDDPYVPDCGGLRLAPGMTSVWYKYTPSLNTNLYLDTFGSSYDTYIAVWSGSRGNLSFIGCNDDLSGHGLQSGLAVSLTAGTTYYFEVAEFSDSMSIVDATSLTAESSLRSSNSGALVSGSSLSQKSNSDIEAQAGGILQFHVAYTANVNVSVGGTTQGNYIVAPKTSLRQSYAGVDNGPVKVVSTNGTKIVASERVAYSPDGGTTWTSHSELMGLPLGQLTNSYTFPWYNNLDLNSQLRFGNVGTANTNVTVTIGGVVKGTYTLAPNASHRVSYAGLDAGPVRITSSGNVPIIASMRVAYFDGSDWTSFSEMMGLPSGQLTHSYIFPWYNNLDLNSQLRFGNVGNAPTTVTVTVAGVFKGSYPLAVNESKRISYAGLDAGPVRITSSGNVPIIASMRVAYFDGSAWTDFSEMMGMPANSLGTHYSFPAYNNAHLNTQLRFGNVGNVSTNVTVTINGILKGTYTLTPNASQRISYVGVNSGPVVIQSSGNVPIIASMRVAYFDGSDWTSFAEMMGLPQSQLSTTFLFPWYNNIDLDTQLRFGVP